MTLSEQVYPPYHLVDGERRWTVSLSKEGVSWDKLLSPLKESGELFQGRDYDLCPSYN